MMSKLKLCGLSLVLGMQACLSPLAWYDTQLPHLPLGSQPAPPIVEQLPTFNFMATDLEGVLEADVFLYPGQGNVFTLLSQPKGIKIEVEGADIRPLDKLNQRHEITPKSIDATVGIILSNPETGQTRRYDYGVRPLPLPKLGFKGHTQKQTLSLADLSQLSLEVYFDDPKIKTKCICLGAELIWRPLNGPSQTWPLKDGQIPKAAFKALEKAKNQDLILLRNPQIDCRFSSSLLETKETTLYWIEGEGN